LGRTGLGKGSEGGGGKRKEMERVEAGVEREVALNCRGAGTGRRTRPKKKQRRGVESRDRRRERVGTGDLKRDKGEE
jgi:hypothetical protein